MVDHSEHNTEEIIRLFSFLSRKYTLAILYEAFHVESIRFSQLSEKLPGISSRTLSVRLSELEDAGFLDRQVSQDKPVTITYRLTQRGRDLEEAFMALGNWTLKWPAG